ncbi:MAG: cytochrome c biogenesis CcdA family protein [Paracoccaceae bacterium]
MEVLRDLGIDAIQSGSLISVFFAFIFGLFSFASPCVLPMAPPYLAYIGGTTLDQLTGDNDGIDRKASRRVMICALFFVLGLGVVFVGLGLGMASAGNLLLDNKHIFGLISGGVIFVFGLHFWGLRWSLAVAVLAMSGLLLWWLLLSQPILERLSEIWIGLAIVLAVATLLQLSGWDKIPVLNREARFEGPQSAGSTGSSFVIGMAFAFGWTPCLGPILGTILSFAAQSESPLAGGVLLGFYALGLGVPFLIAAMFIGPFLRWAQGMRRHLGTIERVMGAMLVVVGLMMITGDFERLAYFLLDMFPSLATVG